MVDLRENKPPSRGGVGGVALAVAMEDPAAPLPPGAGLGGGGGGGGRAPVFATSVLPGELSGSVVSSPGGVGGGGGGGRGKSDRAVEKWKRETAARRRAERRARDKEERRQGRGLHTGHREREERGWTGGGRKVTFVAQRPE